MTVPPRRRCPTARGSRGQALVEFAILASLMLVLIVGGLELTLAALNSGRIGDAARAGAAAWKTQVDRYAVDDGGRWVLDPEGTADGNAADDIALGDHDPAVNAGLANPACNPDGTYDDGLPPDGAAYVFNPLPIDVTGCLGEMDDMCTPGAPGDDRARESVLVSGYPRDGAPGCTAADWPGLPAANQRLYPLLRRDCADATNVAVDCDDTAVARVVLRLPGRPVGGDPAGPVELAMFRDDDADGTSEYIGQSPTLELLCAAPGETPDLVLLEPDTPSNCHTEPDVCFADDGAGNPDPAAPLACNVAVVVRYRHVFETLTLIPGVSRRADGTALWQDPVTDPAALAALDDPFARDPGGAVTGLQRSAIGAELTRGDVRKVQRTFRACAWTVGVPTDDNPVGACE